MSDQEPNEGVGSLFFELAGDLRLSMLEKLSQRGYRLSQLASELDATMQEAHRNVTRLIDSGLVSKQKEGDLVLTAYGQTVVMIIPGYDFLYRNKDFFLDHSLGDLPPKFIQRMGALRRCETVHGVMAILQRWKTMYTESEKYIKEIMAQVPLDVIETVSSRIEQGVKFSYIFASNAVVPRGRTQLLQKVGWRNYISKGFAERRMLPEVMVMTIFNEKQGCVVFPNMKGEPDLNVMFYGEDKEFLEWCSDLFAYQWERAEPFDESKLKHEV
ncbi:MAG TPA: transcriptional regulator [Nitrososphaera sp.]|nr:transcriptional regulator [Nitrososphaera sp.]HEX2014725.1 transcriptional regulator [Nitrososphaera sp.]